MAPLRFKMPSNSVYTRLSQALKRARLRVARKSSRQVQQSGATSSWDVPAAEAVGWSSHVALSNKEFDSLESTPIQELQHSLTITSCGSSVANADAPSCAIPLSHFGMDGDTTSRGCTHLSVSLQSGGAGTATSIPETISMCNMLGVADLKNAALQENPCATKNESVDSNLAPGSGVQCELTDDMISLTETAVARNILQAARFKHTPKRELQRPKTQFSCNSSRSFMSSIQQDSIAEESSDALAKNAETRNLQPTKTLTSLVSGASNKALSSHSFFAKHASVRGLEATRTVCSIASSVGNAPDLISVIPGSHMEGGVLLPGSTDVSPQADSAATAVMKIVGSVNILRTTIANSACSEPFSSTSLPTLDAPVRKSHHMKTSTSADSDVDAAQRLNARANTAKFTSVSGVYRSHSVISDASSMVSAMARMAQEVVVVPPSPSTVSQTSQERKAKLGTPDLDTNRLIMEVAALQVIQDLRHETCSEMATSFTPSWYSVYDFLPPVSAVAAFQGAWELLDVDELRDPSQWLQSFIITGRFYFGGDGLENCLRLGPTEGSVLLEGGVLAVEQGGSILTRTGKSGSVLFFQRFRLPQEEDVEAFQGVWSIETDSEEHCPEWLHVVVIKGLVWKAGDQGGIVKLRARSSVCLQCDEALSVEGDGDILCIQLPEVCLRYQFKDHVQNAWHCT